MALVQAKCTNCGGFLEVDNKNEAAVCKYCGTPFIIENAINNFIQNISIDNVSINVKSKEEEKEEALQELKDLYAYALRKMYLFEEADQLETRYEELLYPSNKSWMLLYILFWVAPLAFALLIGLIAALSSNDASVICPTFGLVLVLGGLSALPFIIYGIRKNAKNNEFQNVNNRLKEISIEIVKHFNDYCEINKCSIGAEFFHPRTLQRLTDYIRQGRADNIKEALNIYLNELKEI